MKTLNDLLKHHVTGAVERGEAEPIEAITLDEVKALAMKEFERMKDRLENRCERLNRQVGNSLTLDEKVRIRRDERACRMLLRALRLEHFAVEDALR